MHVAKLVLHTDRLTSRGHSQCLHNRWTYAKLRCDRFLRMYACSTTLVLKPQSPHVWAAERVCKATLCCNQSQSASLMCMYMEDVLLGPPKLDVFHDDE